MYQVFIHIAKYVVSVKPEILEMKITSQNTYFSSTNFTLVIHFLGGAERSC